MFPIGEKKTAMRRILEIIRMMRDPELTAKDRKDLGREFHKIARENSLQVWAQNEMQFEN